MHAMRVGCLGAIACVTMGNQSCNQQQITPVQGRFLKKTVKLENIRSYNFMIPGGGTFDFQSVMNWQMQQLLEQSDRFVIPMPDSQLTTTNKAMARADVDAINDHMAALAKPSSRPEDQTVPVCLQNLPQVIMDGQVNSFEADGGGGLKIGFTSAGSFGASASFQVDTAQLDLGLRAREPYFGYIIGMTDVTADQTKTSISASINFALFEISPDYYFSTPLVDVSKTAITKGLLALFDAIDNQSIQNKMPIWEGQVDKGTATDNNFIRISAGQIHGVRAGDTFDIFNVHTEWAGQPCQSQLLVREASTSDPVATVQISSAPGDLGINYAYAKIIKSTGDQIYPGAIVRINSLVQDAGSTDQNSSSNAGSSGQTTP